MLLVTLSYKRSYFTTLRTSTPEDIRHYSTYMCYDHANLSRRKQADDVERWTNSDYQSTEILSW